MGRSSRKKRSTRRQSKLASLMIVAAVIMVCIVSGVVVSNLQRQSRELAATEQILQQKIDQANLKHDNLVAQEQYMKTNQYIEDVAKEKLGMVYPDEIVIRPAE
ncbi:MAG: septum formation initiator family protein [Wujia sp.]